MEPVFVFIICCYCVSAFSHCRAPRSRILNGRVARERTLFSLTCFCLLRCRYRLSRTGLLCRYCCSGFCGLRLFRGARIILLIEGESCASSTRLSLRRGHSKSVYSSLRDDFEHERGCRRWIVVGSWGSCSWSGGYPFGRARQRQGDVNNSLSCSELDRRRAVVSMCQWCSSTRDWRRERGVFWSETLGDRDYLVLKLDWLALPHHHQILLMTFTTTCPRSQLAGGISCAFEHISKRLTIGI